MCWEGGGVGAGRCVERKFQQMEMSTAMQVFLSCFFVGSAFLYEVLLRQLSGACVM